MSEQRVLHVFLVAGEESGDRLGTALMRALSRHTGGKVRFSGVGGGGMEAEGLHSLFPLGEAAIVGFAAIPRRLPVILRHIREAADAAIAQKPDVLVIIDSPEFTHRVARRVRQAAPTIPIVDYVCPSVWAWRPGRARVMRGYIDHVLALLPFEPDVLKRLNGPPSTFVGHPLSERVGELRPNAAEQERRAHGAPPLLVVMPGSRRGELRRMLPVFAETLSLVQSRFGALDVAVPAVPHLAATVSEAVSRWPVPVRVVVDPAEKNAAFRAARAALVKSGTGTLELALAGVPMVAGYKVSGLEGLVGRLLISAPSVILANLALGENVIPEFLQGDCTAENMAAALLPLLADRPQRARQIEAFSRLDKVMDIGHAVPSERAADVVLQIYQSRVETVASGRRTA